jgi:hypothetical protein
LVLVFCRQHRGVEGTNRSYKIVLCQRHNHLIGTRCHPLFSPMLTLRPMRTGCPGWPGEYDQHEGRQGRYMKMASTGRSYGRDEGG